MKERIATEDALKHCHESEYQGREVTAPSLAGALGIRLGDASDLLAELVRQEYLTFSGHGAYSLTNEGRRYARRVIRAHRLYETSLARNTGFTDADWHAKAERKEHQLTDAEVERLAARLGDPRWDPHGDPIPTPAGDLPEIRGTDLNECAAGWVGRVSHVEDEPLEVYLRLTAQGLVAGMTLKVVDVDAGGMRVNADGRSIHLDRAAAALVRVIELAAGELFDDRLIRLVDLPEGESARIVGLGPACRGDERHRLLDLGVVPGSVVEVDLISPSGNPVAYRIRGASIALRREQAEHIYAHKVT